MEVKLTLKPLNIKFKKIPNDIPFIANVEIRYSNRLIPKKSISSFFPKNWNLVRIKEEISLIYDELVLSGKDFSKPPFKYVSMNSNKTFEILIEFDKFGNITSAYPNIKL